MKFGPPSPFQALLASPAMLTLDGEDTDATSITEGAETPSPLYSIKHSLPISGRRKQEEKKIPNSPRKIQQSPLSFTIAISPTTGNDQNGTETGDGSDYICHSIRSLSKSDWLEILHNSIEFEEIERERNHRSSTVPRDDTFLSLVSTFLFSRLHFLQLCVNLRGGLQMIFDLSLSHYSISISNEFFLL